MEDKATIQTRKCKCPYCDAEAECIDALAAVCEPCSVAIVTCESCGGKMREGAEECPECGEKV